MREANAEGFEVAFWEAGGIGDEVVVFWVWLVPLTEVVKSGVKTKTSSWHCWWKAHGFLVDPRTARTLKTNHERALWRTNGLGPSTPVRPLKPWLSWFL